MDENFKLDLKLRPRRMRKSSPILSLCEENSLNLGDLIQPVFVIDGKNKVEKIDSMPDIQRYTIDKLLKKCEELLALGVNSIALFPSIQQRLKSLNAKEAVNEKNLPLRAISAIKKRFPELVVIADLALDPYTSHGHDGLIDKNSGQILNDETVEILTAMALLTAEAGADMVAPSDMMDGRVGSIRENLDLCGFEDCAIMAYSAKYASTFYSPFREALGSDKAAKTKSLNKLSYQLNPANSRTALLEASLDEAEGADILMVKPAMYYLDIVAKLRAQSNLPIAAYQVSGEYSMIKNCANMGFLDLDKAIYESLISIKRAGCDMILTYFAEHYAKAMIS
ncbi:MAG: porphobilinogen synthase [Opitutales bacterium]